MTALKLRGKITPDGKLQVDLPEGIAAEDVVITIEAVADDNLAWEDRPWTEEELEELMKTDPKTGAEIAAWLEKNETGWENLGMTGEEWVDKQRRKQQEHRLW